MKVTYTLKLGSDEFKLEDEVGSILEFFEKFSFYSNLPKTAPSGEDDLKIRHRSTNEGYNYYSLVSEQAGLEYKFGQPKEDPKTLYGKGWEPLFKKDTPVTRNTSPGTVSGGASGTVAVAPTSNTTIQGSATQVAVTPPPPRPPMPQQTQPAPISQAASNTTPNAALSQKSSDVLSRFGVKSKGAANV